MKKFYTVVVLISQEDLFKIRNANSLEEAKEFAQNEKGQIWEYSDYPLQDGEDHHIRGKLIVDYKSTN